HGFCSPELACGESHPKKDRWPAVRVQPTKPLRPPDLIIQDELHLISGPLGTLVGLYETAVDKLCTWEVGGKKVRPKVVASTATIRRAGDQVHAAFLRRAGGVPAPGADASGQHLLPAAAPERGRPRTALPRHLFARSAAEGGPDPGVRRVPVRWPATLREVRQGGGPLDDAGRLLQLDEGTRRDAAAGGRRREE